MMTPLLLPPLVVLRLSATENAYFYSTWMLGSVFLIISPAIAASLFAEGARDPSALPAAGRRSLRLLCWLLPLPILVGVAGGNEVLSIFGREYANHGFLLLATLAISAIPDAVTNVAVPLLRIRGLLPWSATLNVGMGLLALGGAWLVMPWLGIVGAGLAWLLAQTVGAVAVLPFLSSVLGWKRSTAGVAAARA
jgi:O-antigen/teichoic acid export membrane protein